MTFCCDAMEKESQMGKYNSSRNRSITYEKHRREYFVYFLRDPVEEETILLSYINYCPWCGTKLPSSLSEEWWDVLEKEYGITDPRSDDRDRVPPEFRTDQWWKKRGL